MPVRWSVTLCLSKHSPHSQPPSATPSFLSSHKQGPPPWEGKKFSKITTIVWVCGCLRSVTTFFFVQKCNEKNHFSLSLELSIKTVLLIEAKVCKYFWLESLVFGLIWTWWFWSESAQFMLENIWPGATNKIWNKNKLPTDCSSVQFYS